MRLAPRAKCQLSSGLWEPGGGALVTLHPHRATHRVITGCRVWLGPKQTRSPRPRSPVRPMGFLDREGSAQPTPAAGRTGRGRKDGRGRGRQMGPLPGQRAGSVQAWILRTQEALLDRSRDEAAARGPGRTRHLWLQTSLADSASPTGVAPQRLQGRDGGSGYLGVGKKGSKTQPTADAGGITGATPSPEITCLAIVPHPEASALLRAGAQRSPVTLSCSLAEGQAPRPLPCVGPETPRVPSVLMPPCSHPLLPQPRPGQSHDSCSRTFPRGPQLPPAPCIQAACGPSLELQPQQPSGGALTSKPRRARGRGCSLRACSHLPPITCEVGSPSTFGWASSPAQWGTGPVPAEDRLETLVPQGPRGLPASLSHSRRRPGVHVLPIATPRQRSPEGPAGDEGTAPGPRGQPTAPSPHVPWRRPSVGHPGARRKCFVGCLLSSLACVFSPNLGRSPEEGRVGRHSQREAVPQGVGPVEAAPVQVSFHRVEADPGQRLPGAGNRRCRDPRAQPRGPLPTAAALGEDGAPGPGRRGTLTLPQGPPGPCPSCRPSRRAGRR